MFAILDLLHFINISVFRFYGKNDLNIIERCIMYVKDTTLYRWEICLLCSKK